MLKDFAFPLLKRRTAVEGYPSLVKNIENFISENSNYPLELIRENVDRLSGRPGKRPFDFDSLETFCHQFRKVYIYGTGVYSLMLRDYFEERHLDFHGFIVTKMKPRYQQFGMVCPLDEVEFDDRTGVVIGVVRPNYYDEVYQALRERDVPEERIFSPDPMFIQNSG